MSNESATHHELLDNQDDEISLGQIIDFFLESWKQLGVGALVSAIFALTGVAIFGTYKAEVIIDNSSRVINFTSWRAWETRLPFLATKILESASLKSEETDQFKQLSSSDWWQKNVIPVYSLSKADTKNLAAVNKELQDAEATSILYLKITNTHANKNTAEQNARFAADFIRNGSAYISLKNLLNGYELNSRTKETELHQKITATEVELASMNRKAKGLEELRRRFPGNTDFASNQVIDPKDSGAKYLPISTQLVAINTDINNTNESLLRIRNEASQQKVMRAFLDKAAPIISGQFQGNILIEKLLAVESELRKSININNINELVVINGIRAELSAMQIRFDKGMEISQSTLIKPNYLLPTLLAGLAGGFVTLLLLLGRRAWINSRVK